MNLVVHSHRVIRLSPGEGSQARQAQSNPLRIGMPRGGRYSSFIAPCWALYKLSGFHPRLPPQEVAVLNVSVAGAATLDYFLI